MDLFGAHLFKTGSHPGAGAKGIVFSEADLDSMVSAFNELRQAGRVPLKAGHNDTQPLTDGKPALGWVSKLYRLGKDLFGDFSDMPEVMYNAIKSKAYKFVSIELLKDAVHAGKSFPWVLDAVALLGADIPAVSGLEDLSRLTLKRDAFTFAAALSFTREYYSHTGALAMDPVIQAAIDVAVKAATQPLVGQLTTLQTTVDTQRTENLAFKAKVDTLTVENAALKKKADDAANAEKLGKVKMARDAVVELLEAAVRSKRILPAQRLAFQKTLQVDNDDVVLTIDVVNVEQMVGMKADEAKKVMMSRSAANTDPSHGNTDAGTDETDANFPSVHAEEVMKFAKANGFGNDVLAAWPEYLRRNPTKGKALTQFCFEPNTSN